MMRTAILLLSAGFLAALAGCSSTSSGGTGASTTTTTGTAGGSTTTTSGTTSTTSAAPTLDCTSYCNVVMNNCTADNAQYTDTATCLGVCAGFTAPGALGDTSGDTLGCRIYHAGAAGMDAASATTHCPHAGPTGGDKDPKGSAGICGEPCTAFCSIAAKSCTGSNQQFTDTTACMTACQGFTADSAAYNTSDTAKNDMGCRFYHVSAASKDATSATTHCPHIVTASPVCTQ